MAVFPDRIVLKNSTDPSADIVTEIGTGGASEITQGELVLGLAQYDVALYAKDEAGNIVTLSGEYNSDTIIAATAPTTRLNGDPLKAGDTWFPPSAVLQVYDGAAWVETASGGSETLAGLADTEIPVSATLLLHCDGTPGDQVLVDSSANNYDITFTDFSPGSNTPSALTDNPVKFGPTSMAFFNDADQQYRMSAPDSHEAVWFGDQDFTVEFWYYTTTNMANCVMVYGDRYSGTNWAINVIGGDRVDFYAFDGAGDLTLLQTPTGLGIRDQWAHIAVTRKGGTLRIFVDGTLRASEDIGVGFTFRALAQQFRLGVGYGTSGFYGSLDELRIIKGTAVYTQDFTVPSSPYSAGTGDGEVLSWDAATQKWIPAASGGGGGGAVDSVNGETGVVSLGIQDMDDFQLNAGMPAAQWDLGTLADNSSGVVSGEGYNTSGGFRIHGTDNQGVDRRASLNAWIATLSFPTSITFILDGVETALSVSDMVDEMSESGSYKPRLIINCGLSANDEYAGQTFSMKEFDTYIGNLPDPLKEGDALVWDDDTQAFMPAKLTASVNGQTGIVVLGASDVNALPGSSGIDALSDVDTSSAGHVPTDGQVLTWDQGMGHWMPMDAAPASVPGNITDGMILTKIADGSPAPSAGDMSLWTATTFGVSTIDQRGINFTTELYAASDAAVKVYLASSGALLFDSATSAWGNKSSNRITIDFGDVSWWNSLPTGAQVEVSFAGVTQGKEIASNPGDFVLADRYGEVRVQSPPSLDMLGNVGIANVTDGDILAYSSGSQEWASTAPQVYQNTNVGRPLTAYGEFQYSTSGTPVPATGQVTNFSGNSWAANVVDFNGVDFEDTIYSLPSDQISAEVFVNGASVYVGTIGSWGNKNSNRYTFIFGDDSWKSALVNGDIIRVAATAYQTAEVDEVDGQVLTWNSSRSLYQPTNLQAAAVRLALGIGEYADDAAAGAGGVASGAMYYNTTSSDYRLKT